MKRRREGNTVRNIEKERRRDVRGAREKHTDNF
jgi:hypothetical protein